MKWITREHVKVDRVACPWLIRRFLDADAQFLFVPEDKVLEIAAKEEALPFDMPRNPELKFTHHDGLCTFEVMIREFALKDLALERLAKIVHAADLQGEEHTATEAPGLKAIAEGFAALDIRDEDRLAYGFPIYDALYAWCRKRVAASPEGESLSGEENKEIVRRYYEALWNAWNLSVADQVMAADIAFRGSLGVRTQGLAGFKQYVSMVRTAFPDFHNTIEELLSEDDKVVARLTYRGTHQGELFGIAPTGKQVTYSGVAIFRIHTGKIAEAWILGDTLGLMQQLGAIPTGEAATGRPER